MCRGAFFSIETFCKLAKKQKGFRISNWNFAKSFMATNLIWNEQNLSSLKVFQSKKKKKCWKCPTYSQNCINIVFGSINKLKSKIDTIIYIYIQTNILCMPVYGLKWVTMHLNHHRNNFKNQSYRWAGWCTHGQTIIIKTKPWLSYQL